MLLAIVSNNSGAFDVKQMQTFRTPITTHLRALPPRPDERSQHPADTPASNSGHNTTLSVKFNKQFLIPIPSPNPNQVGYSLPANKPPGNGGTHKTNTLHKY